jgi:hypothetical protein
MQSRYQRLFVAREIRLSCTSVVGSTLSTHHHTGTAQNVSQQIVSVAFSLGIAWIGSFRATRTQQPKLVITSPKLNVPKISA